MPYAKQLSYGSLSIVVLLCALTAPPAGAEDKQPCSDLQACIRKMPTTAAPREGISLEEQRLAKAINSYGGAAIPLLLPYLKDTNQDVRDLTSYILRGQPGMREEYLPALMESRLRGDGWIPPAIARIGTPKAIAFLVSELKKEREPETQLTWAFKVLGPKVAPPLVELYRCGVHCDAKLLEVCESIFGNLKKEAVAIVPDLKAIALDKTQPLIARRAAVTTLGAIGLSAASVVPDLQNLAAENPAEFGEAVNAALLGMRHSGAVPTLLERIKQGDKTAFADLAELGRSGSSAGPVIVKYLNDPERAVDAVRTLGYIGYSKATAQLVELLGSNDWRVVYAACDSLGQLRAAGARAALEELTHTHWYPPVRDAAQTALNAIDGKEGRTPENGMPFRFEFLYAYEHAGDKLCKREALDAGFRNDRLDVQGGQLVGIDHGEFGGELHSRMPAIAISRHARLTVLLCICGQSILLGRR